MSQADVELRDQLIANQESLLNVYRCMFSIDTQIVAGGCADGRPLMGPVETTPFQGTPTQGELDTRDALIASQEFLLNVYRCMFSIDTQIVPGGCIDGRPGDPPATKRTDATNPTPGDGVRVNMARANWTTGYMQAAILQMLMSELGYEVSDPSAAELPPVTFYAALAEGKYDFWANGWFPAHDDAVTYAGASNLVQLIGNQIVGGALQGFLVDKATAETLGITTLDDIGDNREIAALFDLDGDGKADLRGCDYGWVCQAVIDETIARNGWENTIEQVSDDFESQFNDSVSRYYRGQPILQYAWTPARYTAELVPGTDVIWLSLYNPLPSQAGAAALPADQCPGQPCELGFKVNDIRAVARSDFLAANPAAAKLLELVAIPVIDISRQNLAYYKGANSELDIRRAARQWIADNRANVDRWLAAARAAA